MKMTAWFFCSLLLVPVSMAEAPKTQDSSKIEKIGVDVKADTESKVEAEVKDDDEPKEASTEIKDDGEIGDDGKVKDEAKTGDAKAKDDDEAEDDDEGITGVERGKQLHNQHCVRCHGSELYTRSNRRIRKYSSLVTHVQRCATNLNKQWFEDEVADVADYLDAEFYLFKTPKK